MWCGPCLTPFRNTSMVPRLLISPSRRARKRRRVGLSLPRSRDTAASGLRCMEKGAQLGQVHTVVAVVVA